MEEKGKNGGKREEIRREKRREIKDGRVREKNGVKGVTEGLGKYNGKKNETEREEKRREIKDSRVRGKRWV